jgi:hypothetical protein
MPLNALLVWSRCGLGIECSIGNAFLSDDGSGACCGVDASKASTRANRALCIAASTRNECPTNHFSRLWSLRHHSSAMTESRSETRELPADRGAGSRRVNDAWQLSPLRRRIPTAGSMRALRRGEVRNAYPHTGAVFARPSEALRSDASWAVRFLSAPSPRPMAHPTTSWASSGCLRSLLRSHIHQRAHERKSSRAPRLFSQQRRCAPRRSAADERLTSERARPDPSRALRVEGKKASTSAVLILYRRQLPASSPSGSRRLHSRSRRCAIRRQRSDGARVHDVGAARSWTR